MWIFGEVGEWGEGERKYRKVKRDKVERPKHIKKDIRADDQVREKRKVWGRIIKAELFYVTQTW